MNATKDCKFQVKHGKVWCVVHNESHPYEPESQESWDAHREHGEFVQLPMRHICYITMLCPCGMILMDSDQ